MFSFSALRELMLRRNSVQRFIDSRCRLEDIKEIWSFFYKNPHVGLAVAKNFEMTNLTKKEKFIKIMSKPTLNVIFTGFKGSGKTGLAYWIAEELNKEPYNKKTCILYPINFTPSIMPWYFYPADNEEKISIGDYCIFDEAQIRINSRRSTTKLNVNFSQFLTIQRHKGISMLMIQQDIEMSDLNEFRLADGFIFKPSGITQLREKMNKGNVMMKFLNFLRPLSNKETLYMSSDLQTIILFENPLPSFWSDELSTPTKNISLSQLRTREDIKRTNQERVQKAKEKAEITGNPYKPPKKKTLPKRETETEILEKEYGKDWIKKLKDE